MTTQSEAAAIALQAKLDVAGIFRIPAPEEFKVFKEDKLGADGGRGPPEKLPVFTGAIGDAEAQSIDKGSEGKKTADLPPGPEKTPVVGHSNIETDFDAIWEAQYAGSHKLAKLAEAGASPQVLAAVEQMIAAIAVFAPSSDAGPQQLSQPSQPAMPLALDPGA